MHQEQSCQTSALPKHPLHIEIATTIAKSLPTGYTLLRDPACGGEQHLPLFVGQHKSRETRLCCVDLLIVKDNAIKGIIEIEESGFLPTKICGKFLQAALTDHFIHDSQSDGPIKYSDDVLFLQILDGTGCLKPGTQKALQGELIRQKISDLLPLGGLTKYQLFFVNGKDDLNGLNDVRKAILDSFV